MTAPRVFDPEQYRVSVLEPARLRGNTPPADLLVRYALDQAALRDPRRFHAGVEAVVNYWQTLKQRKAYARLADALLVAHAKLEREGELDPDRFLLRQRQAAEAARERLRRLAAGIAETSSCVGSAGLERLAATLGGTIDAAAVRKALEDHKVRVVDLPELPQEAPTGKVRDIARYLRVLDRRLSAEVVFGDRVRRGFRVLGGFRLTSGAAERLDGTAIERARRRLAVEPQDDRKNAAANILTILSGEVAKPRGLESLLAWEVLELMRPLLDSGLPQRMVAANAAEFGLDPGEAAVMAAALVERRGGRGPTTDLRLAEEALTAGELRTAERLAAALPENETTRPLHARLEAAAARVAELAAQAERARAAGRTEDAAERLAEALRIAADDHDLEQRLRGLPPPPPPEVRATIDAGQVVVRWSPSPARTGRVRYRVLRMSGRAAAASQRGLVVGHGDGRELVDRAPPVGEALTYGVLASRADGDDGWSAATLADPVVLAPEVAELRLDADPRSVTGSWRAHPRAQQVVVTRRELAPPRTVNDGQLVQPATLVGFVDGHVRAGVVYYYRVAAVYVTPDGQRHVSSGVVASATPAAPAAAVTDLEVVVRMLDRGPAVHAAWTPPGGGAVSVHLSEQPPAWPTGTTVAPAELSAFARPLPGVPEPCGDGRVRLAVPPVHGRRFLIAVTVGAAGAVIGNTVELAMVEPVSRLAAERLEDAVRLSWVWPAESTAARVRWWPTGAPGEPLGERRCLRHQYAEQGGFETRVGTRAVTLSVQAVIDERGGELDSAPATVDLPALATSVRYSIRRGGWARRNKATVVLATGVACALPALLVVQKPGSIMPLGPDDGEVIGRVPAQALRPGSPVTVDVTLKPLRGPSWVACFPEAGPGADAITLVAPPIHELKVS